MNTQSIFSKDEDLDVSSPIWRAAGVNADHIRKEIIAIHYHHFPGTTTVVCCLELRNHFTIIGKSRFLGIRIFRPLGNTANCGMRMR